MKLFKYSAICMFAIALLMLGCDKINDPYPKRISVDIDSSIVWDDSASSVSNDGKRFVFMEEYTGHKCPNCPESSEFAIELVEEKSPALVLVSLHAGDFAVPEHEGNKFTTDFRTDLGEELINLFIPISFPRATINRIMDNLGERVLSKGVWVTEIDKMINSSAIANIEINNRYDDSTNIIQNEVIIHWLENVSTSLNLQMYLSEDSIVDWQWDDRRPPGSEEIEDYVHRHVLRLSINGLYGQKLSAATAGTSDTVITNFVLPGNVLEVKHCSITAFIYKPGPSDYEVMQVNEAHIFGH